MSETRETTEATGELLTLAETIDFLGISKQTLYRMMERNELKGIKVGRQWRFRRPDLTAYLRRGPVAVTLSAVSGDHLAQALATLAARLESVGEALPAAAEEMTDPVERDVDRLVRGLLALAVCSRASDIHLEPVRGDDGPQVQARLRVDGVLHEVLRVPDSLHAALLHRVKALAGVNLEERSLPQDGRFHFWHGEDDFDLRVSIIPSIFGESAVLRLLFTGFSIPTIDELYALPENQERMHAWLRRPSGLILVTGPTGSGKTTMLYSALMAMTTPAVKVLSVEDPVEYALPGVVQVAVNRRAGLLFPNALRAFLRQDPDIIMIGELRDLETAEIAMQAALTGHLALTTLHAPDALAAVLRLRDMGLEPFVVADALIGITAQRLVRRICGECRQPAALLPEERRHAQALAARGGVTTSDDTVFSQGAGCARCNNTGFRGRVAITELAEFTPAVKAAFLSGAGHEELVATAVREGMRTLAADGIAQAAAGITTVGEVLRVIG